jgi:single-strand DNA-binding protein
MPAEMRYLPDGALVVNVSIAVNEHINDEDVTTWVSVVFFFWGERLTNAAMHIVKGQTLYVEGRVKVETWTDQQSELRAGLKPNVRIMRFIGGRSEGVFSPAEVEKTPIEIAEDIPF